MTDAVPEQVRRVKILSVARHGNPGGHAPLLGFMQSNRAIVVQITTGEVEPMHHLVACAAAKKLLAIRRKGQAVKRFVHGNPRDDVVRLQVHDHDFVLAVAAMEHGGVAAVRRHGDVHREITEGNLLSHRPQHPLIRQQHRAVASRARHFRQAARQIALRDGGLRAGTRPNEGQQTHGKTTRQKFHK